MSNLFTSVGHCNARYQRPKNKIGRVGFYPVKCIDSVLRKSDFAILPSQDVANYLDVLWNVVHYMDQGFFPSPKPKSSESYILDNDTS